MIAFTAASVYEQSMSILHPYISRQVASFHGDIGVPGDKSISHRAVMFGLLAEGKTRITGLLQGEDVMRTLAAAKHLGAAVETEGEDVIMIGTAGALKPPQEPLYMGNSGTSVRLLMGLVAGYDMAVTFTGDASLSGRPMGRVITPLAQMGVDVDSNDNRLPITVRGTSTIQAISYQSPVASAQVKSCVLLAALRARGMTTLTESAPTRDHSENMLTHFGVTIETETAHDGLHMMRLQGGQILKAADVHVPSDPSSAAFPCVAALLSKDSNITMRSVCINERRAGLYQVLRQMGATLRFENERIEAGEAIADLVVQGGSVLQGVEIDPALVPSMIDEFPILAVAASCAQGTTTMRGLGELRVKESDRLAQMAKNLAACGVNLEEGEESLIIHGTGRPPMGGAHIDTALDHRIAMSFLVLGMVTQKPIIIDDISPVATSFPVFAEMMNSAGAQMTPYEGSVNAKDGK